MKKRIIHIILLSLLLLLCYQGFRLYSFIFKPNIESEKIGQYIYIYKPANYKALRNILVQQGIVKNIESFDWLASKKSNFKNNIKSGKYLLSHSMSNNELINLLRSGNKESTLITFNNIRTLEELSRVITKKLLCDSTSFYNILLSSKTLNKYKLNKYTVKRIFIPNSYQIYWDETPENIIDRMYKESEKFWTPKRVILLKKMGLNKAEVSTLASIVEQEQLQYKEELPIIAGLYINRLNKDMPLQSDPTIKYALKRFNLKRILSKDLKVKSPFNTYTNKGLPPGPISIPSITAINAVLNYKKHNYYYMCSKEDLSGKHNFAKTYLQHTVNAIKYRKALNKKNILR